MLGYDNQKKIAAYVKFQYPIHGCYFIYTIIKLTALFLNFHSKMITTQFIMVNATEFFNSALHKEQNHFHLTSNKKWSAYV
ncbi:hypothetical protein PU13_26300 [Escherichia coli]|nr:hypothetical protein RG28_11105 [Escherichia coli]EEW6028240.1 hypothetical protein [Escherichia coli]KIH08709.1 hypothetical protein PU13_26300 [Escherichia coli]